MTEKVLQTETKEQKPQSAFVLALGVMDDRKSTLMSMVVRAATGSDAKEFGRRYIESHFSPRSSQDYAVDICQVPETERGSEGDRKMFAVAVGGTKYFAEAAHLDLIALVLPASNEDEAVGKGHRLAQQTYPVAQGYTNHLVDVVEIPVK